MRLICAVISSYFLLVGCTGPNSAPPGSTEEPIVSGGVESCNPGFVYSASNDTCYKIALFSACSSYPLDACEQAGCTVDVPTKTCLSPYTSLCSSASAQSSCAAISYCTWDPAAKVCLTAGSLCSASKSQTACEQYSCIWDPKGNVCLSYTGTCASVSDETVCNNSKSCSWNRGICVSYFWTCPIYATQALCSKADIGFGCTWDSGNGGQCISNLVGQCSRYTSSSTCAGTCTWDPAGNSGNGACLAAWQSCSSVTDATTCSASTFCKHSTSAGCVNALWCKTGWYTDCT